MIESYLGGNDENGLRDRFIQIPSILFYSSGNSPRAALDISISVTSHAFHFDLTIETHNIMGGFLY
jgi:hypothetical protein